VELLSALKWRSALVFASDIALPHLLFTRVASR
jgi:hypothetical protein